MKTSDFTHKTIAIIGFGQVGSCFAAMITAFSKNCTYLVVNHSKDIQGRILDLNHAGVMRNNTFKLVTRQEVGHADFIIYTAGKCNTPNQTRKAVMEENVKIAGEVFAGVQLQKHTKIIVVSNPVEIICAAINYTLKGSNEIIGTGTLLDTYRLQFILANRRNINPETIQTYVLGEHGEGMIPIFSQTTNSEIPLEVTESEAEAITHELKTSASSIRKTEDATKYGVSQCVIEILHALACEKPILFTLCVKSDEDSTLFYNLSKSTYLNLPCFVSKSGIIQSNFEMSKQEIISLQKVAKHLEEMEQTIPKLL